MNEGFRFEDLITDEEIAIINGVANGVQFNAKDINKQLIKIRLIKK